MYYELIQMGRLTKHYYLLLNDVIVSTVKFDLNLIVDK
jgi:hypothetical protein